MHAPESYRCPFCLVVAGQETAHALTRQQDIVYQDQLVTAFICSHQFAANRGHTLIVPNEHFENVYSLPPELCAHLHQQSQRLARAMKRAFRCDGLTMMQSNEPAGNQTVWHYHLHIIPRYRDDQYFQQLGRLEETYRLMAPEGRAAYARQLRACLSE